MFAGCLQIMWAHSHLIRAEGIGYLQLIRAENADVYKPLHLAKTNTIGEATHTTEGFSRKLDQLRVLATVGLPSMTAGIAM